jgi:hypothetical protein
MAEILFKAIGQVKTQASETDIRGEIKDVEAELEIFPEFEAALEGIDGYSHLFVLGYFHKLRPDQVGPLQVKPTRLVKRGFKLEDLPVLGYVRAGFSHPSEPNRTHSGSIRRPARPVSQSEGDRFF